MMKLLNVLKILSIVNFLIIIKPGDHVSIPMIMGLIVALGYFFSGKISEFILPLLALVGLILVAFSLKKQNKIVVFIGYGLTYLFLWQLLSHNKLYLNLGSYLYLFITLITYTILSLIVIIKTSIGNDK